MFLGPSGTDEATPVVVNDVSLADPPAKKTNAANKAVKQSMQKQFFFKEICSFIHCQFLLAGCHYIFFFFTGAASKTSRTVSCFMLYMT